MTKNKAAGWVRAVLTALMALLTAALILARVGAEEAGYFYLTAVTQDGTLIVPEKLYYAEGATIREALEASGHTFTWQDGDRNMVLSVDGVSANYTRSDENGGFDLDAPAADISFFCFSVGEISDSARPAAGMQALIRAIADYVDEEPDTRACAAAAYDAAKNRFITACTDDNMAYALAEDISGAVTEYLAVLNGPTYAVSFDDNGGMKDVGGEGALYSEANYPGVSITAVNAWGREYADEDNDGVIMLPNGQYEFHIACRFNHIVGDVTVDGAEESVSVGMWDFDDWLDAENLRISRSGGAGGRVFEEWELSVERGDHYFRVEVPDVAANSIAILANQNPAVFTDEEFAAKNPKMLRNGYRAETGEFDGVERVYDPNDRSWWGKQLQWNSKYSAFGLFLKEKSPEAATGVIRVFLCGDLPGYFRYQDYTLHVDRIPTLSAMKVTDTRGSALTPADSFAVVEYSMVYDYAYRTPESLRQAVITPTPLNEDYEVTVNGMPLQNGSATVDMMQDGSGNTVTTTATVTVSGGGYSRDYTVTFVPMEEKRLTFNTARPGTTLQVFNKDGDEIYPTQSRETDGCMSYLFTMTGEETYTYVVTRGEYFHSTKTFTMEESANKTFTVDVIDDENWLDGLTFPTIVWGSDGSPASWIVEPVAFSPEIHCYEPIKYDSQGSLRYTPVFDETKYILSTWNWDVEQNVLRVYDDLRSGKWYDAFHLLTAGPMGGTLTLRLSRPEEEDGVTYYQDYVLNVKRFCTLETLSLSCGDTALAPDRAYAKGDLELSVKAPFNATAMTVYAPHAAYSSGNPGAETFNYYVKVNGVETVDDTVITPLSGTAETETIYIEVGSRTYPEATRTITLTVIKTSPIFTAISYEPEQAVLTVRNNQTTERILPDAEGLWELASGYTYTYTLTAPGYVGRRNTIRTAETVTGDTVLVLDGDKKHPIPTVTENADGLTRMTAAVSLSIPAAPENTSLDHTLEAEWADFRGTSYTYDEASGRLVAGGTAMTNNGVVDARLPIDAASSTLYWAKQIGTGYASDAVGSPILVDGDLVVYAGDELLRVDTLSGEIKVRGRMAAKSAFSINPPFYYDGMIFVALSDGRIQAFDAATLESLWIYTDPEGGQPNSNITIYDGYLYTGFWVGETQDANFVCLTVTDEDPGRGDEAKIATWTYLQKGGFYWAGAYVCDDFLLVGTDDGKNGYMTGTEFNLSSELLLLDRHTGELLDKRSGLRSDIRCAISYDAVTDAYYFSSKGGLFYQAKVAKDDNGEWKISSLRSLQLDNFNNIRTGPPMSTSTPVVYNGRAYIGVSGVGQFGYYSGHNITVIDLESWSIAYHVMTEGYPQTSGLLTTAYEDTGYVYVYFLDNMTPGKLRMLRDRPGQTAPEPVTKETYVSSGITNTYTTPYALFTPVGEQAQFVICSPICDEYGVMYFKNDSGCLMAFGPSIEKLEVTKQPERTSYAMGDTFDPTGMEVMLTYSNGMTRDVTDHAAYSDEPLEPGETLVALSFSSMYHNADKPDGSSEGGAASETVFAEVAITLTGGMSEKGYIELSDGGAETVALGVYADAETDTADVSKAVRAARERDIDEVRVFLGQGTVSFGEAAIARLAELDEAVIALKEVTGETDGAISGAVYYRLELNGAEPSFSAEEKANVTLPLVGATGNTRAFGLKADGSFGALATSYAAGTFTFQTVGRSGSRTASYSLFAVKTVIPGDVNGDGAVMPADAALTLRYAAELDVENYDLLAGDMNGDGMIKPADAALILRRAAGLS